MNRAKFTLYAAMLSTVPTLVVSLFLIINGESKSFLLTLPIAALSAYLAAHIIHKVTVNMTKNNKILWPVGVLFSFFAFVLFGFLLTIIDAIIANDFSFARYSAHEGFIDFVSGWLFWSIGGFVITSVVSIPLGIHLVIKYKRSNKQFNLDSGADAPTPVN